jgi:signal transduction histidine kinase
MQNFSIMEGQDVNRFGKAMEMLDESISELRRIAHHMMPESLIRFGLQVSLEDFCRAIPIAHFQYFGEDLRLDNRLEVMIYRCAYELINNAIKYAEASNINVQLLVDKSVVALNVQDNGKGFEPGKTSSGSGLENIRTRVSAHNGKMYIRSAQGKGTEVNIEIESV